MFDEIMINGDQVYPDDEKYSSVRCNIRLPWYRGLPLSCITGIDVTIDGKPVSHDGLSLTLHGTTHKIGAMGDLTEVFWFQRHTAALHMGTAAPLSPGPHDMKLLMHVNIPYHAERPYPQVAQCQKRVTLVSKDL